VAGRSRDGRLVASWIHPKERRAAARMQSVADSKSSGCDPVRSRDREDREGGKERRYQGKPGRGEEEKTRMGLACRRMCD
jgi:hypothetical protein